MEIDADDMEACLLQTTRWRRRRRNRDQACSPHCPADVPAVAGSEAHLDQLERGGIFTRFVAVRSTVTTVDPAAVFDELGKVWILTRGATPSTALVPQQKVGFPIPNPAFCSVSKGQRRLGEKEYRAPSVTPGVALRVGIQEGLDRFPDERIVEKSGRPAVVDAARPATMPLGDSYGARLVDHRDEGKSFPLPCQPLGYLNSMRETDVGHL